MGKLQRKFPIQKAIDLEADPMVLGSIDLCRDHLVRACRMDEPCQAGDLILLCTDAWAEWALRSEELGNPPAWSNYWDISSADWEAEIKALRESRTIRFDDTTLVMLRISAEPSAVEPSEALPIESSLPSPTTAQIDENAAEISAENCEGNFLGNFAARRPLGVTRWKRRRRRSAGSYRKVRSGPCGR